MPTPSTRTFSGKKTVGNQSTQSSVIDQFFTVVWTQGTYNIFGLQETCFLLQRLEHPLPEVLEHSTKKGSTRKTACEQGYPFVQLQNASDHLHFRPATRETTPLTENNIKKLSYSAVLALSALLAVPAMAIDPIPGSITYERQHATRLKKAPVGSQFNHDFYSDGTRYSETYVVQSDRSLKLVDRVWQSSH